MTGHGSAVKEAAAVPKGRKHVPLGPKPEERAHGRQPFPEPLAALSALGPGEVGVVTFPPNDGEALDQWRAALWSAANNLRRSQPQRGLLCTTVREDPSGHSLFFWYVSEDEPDSAADQGVGVFLRGYSVAEAAQVLGVSEKTIRRHIKAGRLSATLFNGPRGPEYRIESLEIAGPPSEAADALEEPADSAPAEEPTIIATITAEPVAEPVAEAIPQTDLPSAALAQAELEGAAGALVTELQSQVSAREQRIDELNQEKMQLVGQIGMLMERNRNLEQRLLLLEAPQPQPQPKRPWWRRLFARQ